MEGTMNERNTQMDQEQQLALVAEYADRSASGS
jgi:hypothetical protein